MPLIHQGTRFLLATLTAFSVGATVAFPFPTPAITHSVGLTLARKPGSIPVVAITQLPGEVKTTIQLIQKGGPFPYRKDGTVFGNREQRLPFKPYGYYREYTVPTPGSRDRGARRIVTGQSQEYYYTGNHYQSFVRVKF
ncbi:MAG: ribonuclease domain-containing protein [Leptodesmis sp.]|uniref:ribonuclease domain-containing protein n=1 Tax=Leptodesmis sp. TaxID=3100501 RepID=UPI003D098924